MATHDSESKLQRVFQGAVAARSPFSELPPRRIRDLTKLFILNELELYYGVKPPEQIVETDYSLWECVETGLQFAWPMLPGNSAFYQWVSNFKSYYPDNRWEYREVRRLLEAEKLVAEKSFKILDVGCGKGDFLRGLEAVAPANRFALDLNESATQECRRLGFQAFCGNVTTAMEAGFLKKAEFHVVTAFHCLEHVESPVEFARCLVEATASGGRVLLSTPYSPMSFECDRFDVLNHPPHHMTRWNLSAYRKLAEILHVKMRYFVPSGGALKTALKAFWYAQHESDRPIEKSNLLVDLVRRFPTFLQEYRKQLRRKRTNHGIAADVILVEFMIS